MSDTQTSLPGEQAETELAAADELITAQAEQIRLLREEAAARDAVSDISYDLDEVFVPEGQGNCLECSCEQWRLNPRQGGSACWLCNHDRRLHKRNPAGAQARP